MGGGGGGGGWNAHNFRPPLNDFFSCKPPPPAMIFFFILTPHTKDFHYFFKTPYPMCFFKYNPIPHVFFSFIPPPPPPIQSFFFTTPSPLFFSMLDTPIQDESDQRVDVFSHLFKSDCCHGCAQLIHSRSSLQCNYNM